MRAIKGIGEEVIDKESSVGEFLSEEERDLLVKRLAACGLPPREIVWITGTSGRTVARIMQRWGITRKKPDNFRSRQKEVQYLGKILSQYYVLKEITLDAVELLAEENDLSLKKLFDLIREYVSPSRWAIRNCLACNQPALTSSPANRYCTSCRKKVKKNRKSLQEEMLYQ